ncbi:MAG: creatininase family protein [Hyphomicrobiales bacterium]|nr:creatininase family protein [Hyphomicrobiales bacterium]OQW80698.1 MAG: creatininase [Proteobacteria bacterium ST_bin15]
MSVLWSELSAAHLRHKAEAGALVILPVASTEQHGPHLPTGVDTYLCAAVCERAGRLMHDQGKHVVVAPTLWVGLAEHHVSFGGTFTLGLRTYHALLADLLASIKRAGFKQTIIVNGHGGNIAALQALTTDLTRELDIALGVTTYFTLATESFAATLEDQKAVHHACEAETSMMMAIRPDLVLNDRLNEAHGPFALDGTSPLNRPLNHWRSFKEITDSGVIGDARRATPAKGETLMAAAAAALATKLIAGEPWA